MAGLSRRLDRLERAVAAMGGGVCRLCWGHPFAAVHVLHVVDVEGPGFRRTGERYLMAGEERRVTEDLRCRACGRGAVAIELMDVLSEGPRVGETHITAAA